MHCRSQPVHNALDACISITWATGGGRLALKISRLLGPKWHSPIGSMSFHRAQGRINHRCINKYDRAGGGGDLKIKASEIFSLDNIWRKQKSLALFPSTKLGDLFLLLKIIIFRMKLVIKSKILTCFSSSRMSCSISKRPPASPLPVLFKQYLNSIEEKNLIYSTFLKGFIKHAQIWMPFHLY